MKNWWLDERAHAGAEHLDPQYVHGYDEKAGFDPTDDIAMLRAWGLHSDAVVVDMGTGTGTFTVAVAPLCRRVVAVDVSPAMTAALRERVERLGIGNVTVVEGGFLTYQHDGQHDGADADIVFTRNALHHLPDFWKTIALERIAATLRPGGVLRLHDLIFDSAPTEAEVRIDAWMSGAVSDAAIGWTGEELAEHVRTEFSTYSWLMEAMIERSGFDIHAREFQRAVYGAYTCVRR